MTNTKKCVSVLLSAAGWVLTFLIFTQVVLDVDLGAHLGVGRYVLSRFRAPQEDLFSFSVPGYRHVYHSWLGEVAVALGYRWGGLIGVSLLFSGLGTFAVWNMVRIGRRLGAASPAIFFTPWAAGILYYMAYLRLQLFSLVGLGWVYLVYLKSIQEKKSTFWWWPVIVWLNANLHGGFALSLFFLAVLVGTELLVALNRVFFRIPLAGRVRSLPFKQWLAMAGSFGLCLLAPLVNPYGWRLYEQVLRMGTNRFVAQFNPDWSPLVTVLRPESKFFAFLMIGMIGAVFLIRNKIQWPTRLLILALFGLTLAMGRSSLGLLTVLLPAFWVVLEKAWTSLQINAVNKKRLAGIAGLLLLPFVLEIGTHCATLARAAKDEVFYADQIQGYGQELFRFPAEAVGYLRVHGGPSRMFNDYNWGGYLIWKMPERKVFVYGFMDHYYPDGTSFAADYLRALGSWSGWQETVAKYNINGALLPVHYPLVELLRQSDDWQVLYEDEMAAIFVKTEG